MFGTSIVLFYNVINVSVDKNRSMKFEVERFNGEDRLQPVVYSKKYEGGDCMIEAEDYILGLDDFSGSVKI